VGVIGWVAVVAGIILATGMTARRLARGGRQAMGSVRQTAGGYLGRSEGGRTGDGGGALDADSAPTVVLSSTASRAGFAAFGAESGPALGPVDLVGDGDSFPVVVSGSDPGRNPFGDEFDDWSDGRPAAKSPLAVGEGLASARTTGVVDGARAFSDIYGPAGGSAASAAASAVPAPASSSPATSGTSAPAIAAAAASEAASATSPAEQAAGEEGLEPRQETIPGLARPPRQIELAVEVPAYILPEAELLKKSSPPTLGRGTAERDTAAVILQALAQFGVEARVIGMVVGPRVTRYELQLAPGTKVSKVASLRDDLAYHLATTEIRILTPIPGKSAVGVEVPNQRPDFVTLGDIYREFPKSAGPLMVWLGKDISGKAVYTDLTRLPHLLIAGTTGSGKSGCVNCIVSSILLRATPEQVRFIMVDPKKVELSHYDRIPHLLVPVVTNMKDAAGVLHNVAKEMEDRYELMELEHSRSLADMNKARARRGERPLPYIVIVIDELADLMMVSPQEVEDYVIRLAQKSRAVGIHLVVATQRPSADVITGMIKANIPSRIAFAVSSQTDSRVILDVNGAETLLGRGDMLFKPLGSSHLQRVQGAYITEEEIALLVSHWRHQAEPEFREELLRRPPDPKDAKKGDDDLFDPDSDDLLADAAQLVIETGSASVSMLQRRLRVGYTRAGRLIDMLERRGIVGPWEGSKPRQILVEADEVEHVLAVLRAEEHGGRVEDRTYGD
jgi:S-DNA-T family DNA segregation ATPase FtsK/SpoIIIE